MSREEVSTSIRSKRIPRIFQCRRGVEAEWNFEVENGVVETSFDCEVTCSRQSLMTSDSKPKTGGKKPKSPGYRVTEATGDSSRPWGTYCQASNGNCEATQPSDHHHDCERETDAETVEDIEKWLKTRTESVSSIDMDTMKSEVDEGVGRYLGDELPHSFLEKDPDGLSIDIDLSDKKLNLGYDPILQELQSEKLLEVCEKDEFILPEFQLDQLDPLIPNDMMVAGEILPSTSTQPSLSMNNPDEYWSEADEESEALNPEDICDKSTQVNVYDLHGELVESNVENSRLDDNVEDLHRFIDEPESYQDIQAINTTSSIDNFQVEGSSVVQQSMEIKPRLQPSIMKKRRKVPDMNINSVAIEGDEDCQTEPKDGIMAVVAISTDKRSNMTQIVINTGKEEQIYQGKTSELMEATGYFSKLPKINTSTAWNQTLDNCTDNSGSINNHEIIITRALEELGYTDDNLVSVALPENGKAWICPREDCRREFNRLYALKSHLLTHYGVRPFKCDFEGCTWAFYSDFKLKRHKETHLKHKNYVCQVGDCNRRFTTVYNLWSHQKLHTRPNRVSCQVPECEEKFQTKRALELHMKTHDQSHAPYVCSHEGCTKRYFSSNALTSHQRCHSYKEVDIKCSWLGCGKVFDKPCRLKAHLRSHTGSKPYLCTFSGCEWAFTSSSKLKRHEKKHTNDRKFICDVVGCSKAFMRSEHLKEHKLTHSEGRYFQCYMCDARFSAKSSLYVHIKKHQMNKETLDASNLQSLDSQLNFAETDNVDELCNDLPIKMVAEFADESMQLQLDTRNPTKPIRDIPAENTLLDDIVPPKPRFACPVENCTRSYLTKSSLKTHTLKVHGQIQKVVTPSDVAEMDYTFFACANDALETSNQMIALELDNTTILNGLPETTLCLPEPEPPPPLNSIKNVQSNVEHCHRVKRSHGSARTGLTCSDVWQLKTRSPMTLNSIVGPSDVDLGTADLSEGLLLTEELPSMYYQDDIVGTECQILLLDPAVPESTINLRDLE